MNCVAEALHKIPCKFFIIHPGDSGCAAGPRVRNYFLTNLKQPNSVM